MIVKLFRSILNICKLGFIKIFHLKKFFFSVKQPVLRLGTIFHFNKGEIIIGKRMKCEQNCKFDAVSGKMEIGDNCNFNCNCIVTSLEKINIGDNCSFGPNVCIYDHDHSFGENGLIPNKFKTGTVVIDEHCWIGAGAIILRNTHIGKNCVIGAGVVVKGNIPDNSLVTGDRSLKVVPLERK